MCLTAAVLTGAALVCGVVTAGTLSYAIGDKVALSGTAYATNTMYLFVTGPGLDPNGVNPGQMKSPVVSGDPSTFVQVDVENDNWSYIWNTAHQGFSLKEGTYTIYAVSQPVGKNALPAVYGTIEISLSQGGESLPTWERSLSPRPLRERRYMLTVSSLASLRRVLKLPPVTIPSGSRAPATRHSSSP